MWNLATNQNQAVGQHDAPIKHMFFVEKMSNMLVTGSWDRTMRYWDLRQPKPAHVQQVAERIFAMDIKFPLAVLGLANRRITIFNLSNPTAVYKDVESPLKYQTRCVTAFPDQSGYLVGSIEGRVAVHHVEEHLQSKNFTFKCHRDQNDIFAINSMTFHPTFHTFVTTGADGNYNFWDKDSKQRLKNMARCSAPIPCGAFNKDGSIYSYAVSYDWSKGYAEHNPATAKNYILLHAPTDGEVKTRPRPAQRR